MKSEASHVLATVLGLAAAWLVVGLWAFAAIFLISHQAWSPSGTFTFSFGGKWWGIFVYSILPISVIGVAIFAAIVGALMMLLPHRGVVAMATVSATAAMGGWYCYVAIRGDLSGRTAIWQRSPSLHCWQAPRPFRQLWSIVGY